MTLEQRVQNLDWTDLKSRLDQDGFAVTPPLLTAAACRMLASLYGEDDATFRSKVIMARHSFGQGEYKYFAYPLPTTVETLRHAFYAPLAALANEWSEQLGEPPHWPAKQKELTAYCRKNGQQRPTPLMLKYEEGDYNCLHQDVYGDIQFPFQVIILLSHPGDDFGGGELVLVQQRPRQQSRPMVVPLCQGAAAVIPVRFKPQHGTRGWRRTQIRHGVSEVTNGKRMTLGLIFHDAA